MPRIMLTLFSAFLGAFDFDVWDTVPLDSLRLYGIIMLVAYLVVATILLANLLIAIISYKWVGPAASARCHGTACPPKPTCSPARARTERAACRCFWPVVLGHSGS